MKLIILSKTMLSLRKRKLVIVDLAGSGRVNKSGSEGHMLEEEKSTNLSLSSLGKCINALAENSSHVHVRESKLTRMLKDSFVGTSRTSLVVTIGTSPLHRAETSSTILFGQREEKLKCQMEYMESIKKLKEKWSLNQLKQINNGLSREFFVGGSFRQRFQFFCRRPPFVMASASRL